MKKMIVLLALASLATLAFGQDKPAPDAPAAPVANALGSVIKDPVLTIGGTFESGVAGIYNGTDSASLYLRGDRQNGGVGGRLDINSKVDMGDAGVIFQLRAENWNAIAGSVYDSTSGKSTLSNDYTGAIPGIKAAYAYSYFLSRTLFVAGGALDTAQVKSTGDEGWSYTKANSQGLELTAIPSGLVPGLTVDFFVGQFNKSLESAASLDGAAGASGDYPRADQVGYAFQVGYAVPNVVTVKAGTQITYIKVNSAWFNISASKVVPNLTVELEGKVGPYAKGSFSDAGDTTGGLTNFGLYQVTTELNQWVMYNFKDMGMAPLTAGFLAYEWVPGTDSKVIDGKGAQRATTFKINPYVSYAVNDVVVPKLGFSYITGSEAAYLTTTGMKSKMVVATATSSMYGAGFIDPNASYSGLTTAQKATASYGTNGMALFQIRPEIALKLSTKADIVIGYSYVMSVGADDLTSVSNFVTMAGVTSGAKAIQSADIDFKFTW